MSDPGTELDESDPEPDADDSDEPLSVGAAVDGAVLLGTKVGTAVAVPSDPMCTT